MNWLDPLSVFVLGSLVISTLAVGMLLVWRYILPNPALLTWGLAQAIMVGAGVLLALNKLWPQWINLQLPTQVLFVSYALPWLAASYYAQRSMALKPVLVLFGLVSCSSWYAYQQHMLAWHAVHGPFLGLCLFGGAAHCLYGSSFNISNSRRFTASVFALISLSLGLILIQHLLNLSEYDPLRRQHLAAINAVVLLFGNLCWGLGVMLMVLGDVVGSLRQSEREARIAATALETHIGVMVTDAHEVILKVNAALSNLLGFSSQRLLGNTPRLLQSGHHDPQFYQAMHQSLRDYGLWEGEIYNQTARGEQIPLWVTITALQDPQGQLQYFVATYTDIRQRKEDEARLVAALATAQAATQAKSAFLANMSHEIRTPMNAIIGFSELSLAENTDPRIETNLRHTQLAARNLLDIINDVLDLSKIEAGKLELERTPFNLSQLLSTLIASVQLLAQEKRLKFEVKLVPGLPPVLQGDPVRLVQILTNLLTNAIKFTPEGRVQFEVELLEQRAGAVQLAFWIRDTGIGMTDSQLERLFQPFMQAENSTSRQYGGTGLGLAISKNLVDMMGGELDVESEPGCGSCFSLRLVLALAEPDRVPVRTYGLPDPTLGYAYGRILVVEDNRVNQLLAVKVLERLGLSVIVAENGRQALDLLSQDRQFSLILMDIQMPELDGLETTRRIRQDPALKDLVILAMTANAFEEDRLKAQAAGMNGFISKPFELSVLIAALDPWLVRASPAEPTQ